MNYEAVELGDTALIGKGRVGVIPANIECAVSAGDGCIDFRSVCRGRDSNKGQRSSHQDSGLFHLQPEQLGNDTAQQSSNAGEADNHPAKALKDTNTLLVI